MFAFFNFVHVSHRNFYIIYRHRTGVLTIYRIKFGNSSTNIFCKSKVHCTATSISTKTYGAVGIVKVYIKLRLLRRFN